MTQIDHKAGLGRRGMGRVAKYAEDACVQKDTHHGFRSIALRDWLVGEGWKDLFLDLVPERGIAAKTPTATFRDAI
jgi:hypothetical protein